MERALYLLALLSLLSCCSGALEDEMQQYEHDCLSEDKLTCHSGGCIDAVKWCDGSVDCSDGTDENFCLNHQPDILLCNITNQFMCRDHLRCIPRERVCNNETDCLDGSDEKNCLSVPIPSSCHGFQCDSGKCISSLWVCDGLYDCKDLSDEKPDNCRHTGLTHWIRDGAYCPETEPISFPNYVERSYGCVDASYCLPAQYMCNGVDDCRDGSDEGPFCERWSTMCQNSTCHDSARCSPDRGGPACVCARATVFATYDYTTHKCVTDDACRNLLPACAQACAPYEHGFPKCFCAEGYTLDKYGYMCFAEGPEGLLFFSTLNEIKYYKLKSEQIVTVASGLKQVHGVAYDGEFIFWIETMQENKAVVRAHLDDIAGTKEVILAMGLEDPGHIAIDPLGDNLYLSDAERGVIIVCKRNGIMCTVLKTRTKTPKFVTLDPPNGKMYWADKHYAPSIMVANMDGSDPKVLVDMLHTFANGIAIDSLNDRLYLVDEKIKAVRLSDQKLYTLFNEPVHHPYTLAVFESFVFWSDLASRTLQKFDKISTVVTERVILATTSSYVSGLHVYHELLYKKSPNPCANASCSHLCFVTSNTTHACGCPSAYELVGNHCQIQRGYQPSYLVLGSGRHFTRLQLDVFSNPHAHAAALDAGRAQALAMDRNDTLYLYDAQRKSINFITMADFTTGVTQVLLSSGLHDVVDMDYDPSSHSLIWVDAGSKTVELLSLRNKYRTIIYRFIDGETPVSLCVLSEYGKLWVAVSESAPHEAVHIDEISFNGHREHVLRNNLIGPRVMLRYSHANELVYILDEGSRTIDSIHPRGIHRKHYLYSSTSLFDLALSSNFMFWTGRKSNNLYWSDIHEVSPKRRRMDLTVFSPSSLHLAAPPAPAPPAPPPPCLSSICSHICVPLPHLPHTKPLPYTCLCPSTMVSNGRECEERRGCRDGELYCRNSNECFEKTVLCDGKKDCLHGEDEEDCDKNVTCSIHEILCNGECIDKHMECEPVNSTNPVLCAPYEFSCVSEPSLCIDSTRVCDGNEDCQDGSDERHCGVAVCPDHMFMCRDGGCIVNTWKCDGENDCLDGSDEIGCSSRSCGVDHFSCGAQCVPLRARCDGRTDCGDGADEGGCVYHEGGAEEAVQECAAWEFACTYNKSICLPLTSRCNSQVDCPGASDEINCHECSQFGAFRCNRDKWCLSIHKVCDGIQQCTDGSDETQQACELVSKNFTRSSEYLPSLDIDCEGFRCLKGQCLDLKQVCDNTTDCVDDEGGLCSIPCTNQSCVHECHSTPTGPRCFCYPGFSMTANGSCVDIDECDYDVCPQVCHNAPGKYMCSCHVGYGQKEDHRSCKALTGNMSILYVSGNSVRSMTRQGVIGAVEYKDPGAVISDIAYLVSSQKLYVTTSGGKLAEVINFRTTTVITNIGNPTKVTVDWVSGNVFFVDSTRDNSFIRVCHVRRQSCARLQRIPNGHEVTAIAIDPAQGLLFYCVTQNSESTVISSSFTGRDINDVITAHNCTGLTTDTVLKRLFVAENSGLTRVTYDGKDRKSVIPSHPLTISPIGAALFEDYIYFINNKSMQLSRCLLYDKKQCETYLSSLIDVDSFVIRHESTQRSDVKDVCVGVECEGVCVLEGGRAVCVCSDGGLAKDGRCAVEDHSLLPQFALPPAPPAPRGVSAALVVSVLTLVVLYVAFFVYYQYVYKKRSLENQYEQVSYSQNRGTNNEETIEIAAAGGSGREFTNPLQMIRDLRASFQKRRRPVGTAGLSVDVPPSEADTEQNLSSTESDQDDKETKNIIPDIHLLA